MSELAQKLSEFEAERIRIQQKIKRPKQLALLLLLVGVGVLIIQYWVIGIACLIGALAAYIVSEIPKDKFRRQFKVKLIDALAKQLNPSLEYHPGGKWTYSYLYDIGLVNTSPNRGKSEDFFQGVIAGLPVAFCEQTVERKTTSTNSKGQTTSSVQRIFKGLVIEISLPNPINGEIYVLPDWAENSSWKWLAKKFQSEHRRGNERILFDNAAFEQLFMVYGSSPDDAKKLLNPGIIEQIMRLHEQLNHHEKAKILLAFKHDKIHLAIEWSKDMFEYDFKKTVQDEVRETFEELKLCLDIVESIRIEA